MNYLWTVNRSRAVTRVTGSSNRCPSLSLRLWWWGLRKVSGVGGTGLFMSALQSSLRFIDGKAIRRDLLLQKCSIAIHTRTHTHTYTHTHTHSCPPPPAFYNATCLSFTLDLTVTVEAVLLLS